MLKPGLLLFVVSLYPALVCADYTIDDGNYSVLKFSENPAGPVWGPFGSDTGEVLEIRLPNGTMQTVDATRCYDGTFTYAACRTSNNCTVEFSFTGSGIIIYVLQAGPQGMAASLSIDSGSARTATLDAPPPPHYYIPHVTLFDIQNILSGTHGAVLTVLDWNGGFSGMMLDYIDINQTEVASPAATPSPTTSPSADPGSSTPTQSSPPLSAETQTTQPSSGGTQTVFGAISVVSVTSVFSSYLLGVTAFPSSTSSENGTLSPTFSSSASNKSNVAAIAGGAGGGLGLLAALALTFFYCRRLRRRQHLRKLNERPTALLLPQPEAGFTPYDGANVDPSGNISTLPTSRPSGIPRPLESRAGSEAESIPDPIVLDRSTLRPFMNYSHARASSSTSNNASRFIPVSIGAVSAGTLQNRNVHTSTQPTRLGPSPAAAVSHPDEKSWTALLAGQAPPTMPRDLSAGRSLGVLGTRPAAILTDEQVDFVNSLFNNNVPAPVVASVIERMVRNPQGLSNIGVNDPELHAHVDQGSLFLSPQTQPALGSMPWLPTMSDIEDVETTVDTAPPSYDYVREMSLPSGRTNSA